MAQMGWRAQVLLGRLRDQAAVLATVTLVTFVATTLLGTFAFLLHATGDGAVDAALARVPDSELTLETKIRLSNRDVQAAVDAASTVIGDTLGDVPTEQTTWLTGRLWMLPRDPSGGTAPMAYPASTPAVPEHAELLSGAWPERARDDAGRTQVNVPDVAAKRYGWSTGTEIPVRTLGGQTTDTWVVVGTHVLTGGSLQWSRDLLGGTGHDAAFPVPGSGGRLTADVWGPVVVAPETLLGAGTTETANVLFTPTITDLTPGALTDVRTALDTTQARLSAALKAAGVSGIVRTDLGTTIDAAARELAVTRIGVIVVGLLLVVLATTVMLLTARLLSERRAGEGALLAARGGAPHQLRSLAVAEAALIAVLTAAVSPLAARAVFDVLADRSGLGAAGLRTPPGVPTSVWLACGAVAVVLAVALVVPAWHVSGSSSAAPHAALVRTGADLGLVAVAGVVLWQLVDYGAPLTQGTSGVRLDPVLVAGPALVALAAAVLALRLVGPVAHGADVLARRSRSLVAPLAAWQVSRRTAAATGTTLVVVLAVGAATFSQAFQATWRESQLEQVDLALGTDARIDGQPSERLTGSADVRAGLADAPPGTRLQPVVDRTANLGRNLGPDRGTASIEARLVAADTTDPGALRGRSDPSWATLVDQLGGTTGQDAPGVPLPGEPQWIVATVTPGTQPYAEGRVDLQLAIEDEVGVRSWLSAPELSLGSPSLLVLEVPRSRGPLRLVALRGVVGLQAVPAEVPDGAQGHDRLGRIGVALHDLRVVDRTVGAGSDSEALTASETGGTAVETTASGWQGSATTDGTRREVGTGEAAAVPTASSHPVNALVVDGAFDMVSLVNGNGVLVAHAWPSSPTLPVVVTSSLAERAASGKGAVLVLRAGGAQISAKIQEVTPHLPGTPRGPALLADRTALARAVTEAGGTDPLVDAWWLTAPDEAAPVLAAEIARSTGATATVRVTEREAAVAGPLRVAVPAALSLVTGATLVLVLVGLGASTAAAVRSRRLELARLQALGAGRRSLVAGLVGEHALLVALGAVAGAAIGYGLARVVAPILTVSTDGRRPVPAPVLVWDPGASLALTTGLAAAACAVVAVLAAALVRRASGALLRLGDDR
ncbi:hypothetical protein J1G44_15905 [Cellulomonas sp. zg-ZUI199]|uniref:ABC3 transporter permease C-terminal domain-containing protein n=2 Tax=Cellulomonas wangleii TaxID=2816956 RepID=A0ABX8D742_9CELL|nr:hypothetical protein [Cellulomonas wangleii]QVI63262.1 hypothetical protein KG103_05040 [Cellulomonas wangleii]